jgi:hypothetical protein
MQKPCSSTEANGINADGACPASAATDDPVAIIEEYIPAVQTGAALIWADQSDDDDLAHSLARCYHIARDRARSIRQQQPGALQDSLGMCEAT